MLYKVSQESVGKGSPAPLFRNQIFINNIIDCCLCTEQGVPFLCPRTKLNLILVVNFEYVEFLVV